MATYFADPVNRKPYVFIILPQTREYLAEVIEDYDGFKAVYCPSLDYARYLSNLVTILEEHQLDQQRHSDRLQAVIDAWPKGESEEASA